jgi:methionyl-tRNA formyltransferase
MSVVFFGSPQFAATILRDLVGHGVDVRAVVCQPDKPAGRGQQLRAPAVKVYAASVGLPVYQPEKVRDGTLASWLREQDVDLAIVAAYGRILTQQVLDAPRRGCVNVHASLLPRWRGASPIARAIAAGDAESGVCLMQMDAGLDTGAVLAEARLPIEAADTTPLLEAKLAGCGARLLLAHLPQLLAGTLPAVPQPSQGVTWAPPLQKHEGRLDFTGDAAALHARARAMQPWPGAFFAIDGLGEDCKVATEGLVWDDGSAAVGVIAAIDRQHVWVGCGRGRLGIAGLQRPGKSMAAAPDVLRGMRRGAGDPLVDVAGG